MKKLICALAALGALAACSETVEPIVADPETARVISSGSIIGFSDAASGSDVWLGVPFAEPPVGDLRWREAVAHTGWDDTLEALDHGAPCPQMITNSLAASAYNVDMGAIVGAEDCLFADIYAPEGAEDGEPLPVMVWIHGGSNLWGTTADYSGAQLAAEQNVIVVMVQYRMGPFGFFAHPEIFNGEETVNFAHSDHVQALNWVQENAATFGGDPDRVTVFGESAGGRNTGVVLQSPMTAGLFHRAIIQSGFFASSTLEEAQVSAIAVGEALDATTADGLRAVPMEQVFDPYREGDTFSEMPRVIADGVSIPLTGLQSAFDDPEGFNRVPVITGTNKDEMKLFNAVNDELTKLYFGFYITVPDQEFYDAVSHYPDRNWRLGAVDTLSNQLLATGHEEVWAYRFDWDEGGSFFGMDFAKIFGAAHAFEIPFVFNYFDVYGQLGPTLFNDKNAEGRAALAADMGQYWAEFARTGDPGTASGLTWERWDEGGRLIRFDSPDDGGNEIITGPETAEAILSDLLADDRLSLTNKCRLLNESLVEWSPQMAYHPLADDICAETP